MRYISRVRKKRIRGEEKERLRKRRWEKVGSGCERRVGEELEIDCFIGDMNDWLIGWLVN